MKLKERVSAFVRLGEILNEAAGDNPQSHLAARFRKVMEKQQDVNMWFTPESVRMAVGAIGSLLTNDSISEWTANYNIPDNIGTPLDIGVVMAGNIPLVGFNDLLNVLISGHRIIAKSSTKDSQLISCIADTLSELEPGIKEYIKVTAEMPDKADAIIATGSDNSSRYFEYYFANRPHIFRKNRTSISIITQDTTDLELALLGSDLFSYFGMGCRNVSKIFIHDGFDLNRLQNIWSGWSHLADHKGWKNNYDHNRALMTIDHENFTNGGFFLLKESEQTVSPLSVVHYEFFKELTQVERSISANREKIQCIIATGFIPYGNAQHPGLSDYADNVDTIKFLLTLK